VSYIIHKIDEYILIKKIILTLQLLTQNGIRQQPKIPPKMAIPKQSPHANKPAFFSTRVTTCFPHRGHVHCVGLEPTMTGVPTYMDWIIGGDGDDGGDDSDDDGCSCSLR
jgi:hypothetical protein